LLRRVLEAHEHLFESFWCRLSYGSRNTVRFCQSRPETIERCSDLQSWANNLVWS
jgi:hypothetical protein